MTKKYMKVCMITRSDMTSDMRIHKEAKLLVRNKYEVVVISSWTGNKSGKGIKTIYKVIEVSVSFLGDQKLFFPGPIIFLNRLLPISTKSGTIRK